MAFHLFSVAIITLWKKKKWPNIPVALENWENEMFERRNAFVGASRWQRQTCAALGLSEGGQGIYGWLGVVLDKLERGERLANHTHTHAPPLVICPWISLPHTSMSFHCSFLQPSYVPLSASLPQHPSLVCIRQHCVTLHSKASSWSYIGFWGCFYGSSDRWMIFLHY